MSDILTLEKSVFDLVEASRLQLADGMVDLSPVEGAVRSYCEALQAMPLDEAKQHSAKLSELSEAMRQLEHDLQRARFSVQQQLANLNRVRAAEVAYRKSDQMGEVPMPPEEDDLP